MTNEQVKFDVRLRSRGRTMPSPSLPFEPKVLRRKLTLWYAQNDRQLPWRIWWEKKRDPYHVWVSEIMLQQTTIKAVIPVYERFIGQFPTVAHLAQASEDQVRSSVRGLGYYRRFRFLHQAAQHVSTELGHWPTTFAGWKSLPGIGDYTAAAVSSIAFGESFAVVDGNVERVLCRLLDWQVSPAAPGLKPLFKKLAQDFLDPERPGDFNQAMMELGQLCCTVTAPSCEACPLRTGCLAYERKTQHLAPQPKPRKAPEQVSMRLGIIHHKGQVALFERPSTARFLRRSWGFVTGLSQAAGTFQGDGWDLGPIQQLFAQTKPLKKTVKHMITHHQLHAQVVPLQRDLLAANIPVRWVAEADVEEALVSNLDRKAWKLFQKELRKS